MPSVPSLSPAPAKAGTRDYVLLNIIVLTWGFTAILGRLISLSPVVIVVWRTGIAAAVLLAMVLIRRLPWPGRRELILIMGGGALIGAHWILFFLSARVGTVSVGLAGLSTLALWVAVLEPLTIRGRRWSWAEVLLAGGVIGGVLMLDYSDSGLLIGIAAAALAAGSAILNSRLIHRHPALMISLIQMATACVMCLAGALLAVPAEGYAWWPQAADWLWLLTLSLVCTVFAYSACVEIQRRVSAFSLGMISNLEPLYGMILAQLVFGASENQPLRFYIGSAIIIGFVILHTALSHRAR